ncbi:MAG: asparaginase [Gemmatimonadota bacterium]|nr:asparaginase [Gemmatimonadota bacterium]
MSHSAATAHTVTADRTPVPRALTLIALMALTALPTPPTAHAQVEGGGAQDEALPRVVVLATGGTIASRYDEEAGALRAALTGDEIVEAVPELEDLARMSVEQIANVNSWDMTPDTWRQLERRTNALLAEPDVAGVIVTHGTDTLEETAYFLDLTVRSDKPVIVIGAQRSAMEEDSDGPRNLLNAVRVAVSPEAVGKGAMVVMNGQINAAREVTKTNTMRVETFQTLDFGLLGVADVEEVRFYRSPTRRQTIPLRADDELPTVEIVMEYAGSDGRVIRALLEQDTMDGLVVAGVGLGHVSSGSVAAIEEVRARGIPVVTSTRVLTGRVVPLYSNNIELLDAGVVLADNLSPQKARVLLMLAMTRTTETEALQAYFDR